MEHDSTETEWEFNDPKWTAYNRGWKAGYDAAHQDALDRLTPEDRDQITLERLGALLRDLRERDSGIF